ncbi:MAG TPA: hypothetical protein PLY83_03900 [Synergistales bacterium]|nr:hypothetical protein [Synergistales bacterium]
MNRSRTSVMERMYRSDMALVGTFFILMWTVLLYVLLQVNRIAPDTTTRTLATVAALLVGGFASGALAAVAIHLRKHREDLYREDCKNSGL